MLYDCPRDYSEVSFCGLNWNSFCHRLKSRWVSWWVHRGKLHELGSRCAKCLPAFHLSAMNNSISKKWFNIHMFFLIVLPNRILYFPIYLKFILNCLYSVPKVHILAGLTNCTLSIMLTFLLHPIKNLFNGNKYPLNSPPPSPHFPSPWRLEENALLIAVYQSSFPPSPAIYPPHNFRNAQSVKKMRMRCGISNSRFDGQRDA